MYERFTDCSKKIMQLTKSEAHRLNHEYLSTEHLLLGMAKEGCGVAAHVLKNHGLDYGRLRTEIEKITPRQPDMVIMGQFPLTPRMRKVLFNSMEAAAQFGHTYIGTEHLLLGLLREAEGIATALIESVGINIEAIARDVILSMATTNEMSAESR